MTAIARIHERVGKITWDSEAVAINLQALPFEVAQRVINMRRRHRAVYVSMWCLFPTPKYALRTIPDKNGPRVYAEREKELLEKGYKLVIGKYTMIDDGIVVEMG